MSYQAANEPNCQDRTGAIELVIEPKEKDLGGFTVRTFLAIGIVRGDLDAAAACYREAIDRAPGFAPAHAWLGVTLYEQGDGDGALASLTRRTADV